MSVFAEIDNCLLRLSKVIGNEMLHELLVEIERMTIICLVNDSNKNDYKLLDYIAEQVCLETSISAEDLFWVQLQRASEARAILFYTAQENTKLSLTEISLYFHTTYTTVYKSVLRMKSYLQVAQYQPLLKQKLDKVNLKIEIFKKLQNG